MTARTAPPPTAPPPAHAPAGPGLQPPGPGGPPAPGFPPAPGVPPRGPLPRLGALVYRHRRLVLLAWLVLLAGGMLAAGTVFGHLTHGTGAPAAESSEGTRLLAGSTGTAGRSVIAVVDGPAVDDPATKAAVQQLSAELAGLPYVARVDNPYTSPDPGLRATDGRAGLVVATLTPAGDGATGGRVDEIRRAVAGAVPGATIKVGGEAAITRDETRTSQQDLVRGELVALPILLLALVWVFRGLRAALLPLAGALVTVAGAMLVLLATTGFVDVAPYAVDVVGLFGLALAVDYSLLMVNRFREERAAGAVVPEAIQRTVAAAGRTIAFSALVVIAALAGLFVFASPIFTSLAIGGIATVAVALLAGLTLVPALLGTVGRKIEPAHRQEARDGWFGRLARAVQHRPALVALGVAAVLLGAGAPFLHVNYSSGDHRVLPASMESRQATDMITERFTTVGEGAVQVVGRVPAGDPRVTAYADRAADLPDVAAVGVRPVSDTVSVIELRPEGAAQGEQAQQVVHALRTDRPGYPSAVTGDAARLIDMRASITDRLPWAIGLIVALTFVLLFLMTGSVLVPLKALLMNILSLGATFGAMVWIFQDGHLSGLLGFTPYGALELWIPTIAAIFAFGLSMDYEVFLLSRIKEAYEESGDSDAAVADGLQRSGRIITSAAVLVIIVFLGFATGQNLAVKQMGVALATAVAVDVTLVRCLLVPATMTLLGRANWWAPRPLRWLHGRVGLREAAPARRAAGRGTTPAVAGARAGG